MILSFCLITILLPANLYGKSNSKTVDLTVQQPEQLNQSGSEADENGSANALLDASNDAAQTGSMKKIIMLINGSEVTLTDPIKNINGRTFYPFRSCLESMGAVVQWQDSQQTATGTLGGQSVQFTVASSQYSINGKIAQMTDAVTFLDPQRQRVYIPIRYAAEALGYTVTWQSGQYYDTISLEAPKTQAVLNETNAVQLNGRIVKIGDSRSQVINTFGSPSRIDESAYGLQWYVYNRQYESFIMVGIKDNKVAGFFTNAKNMKLMGDLGQGAIKSEIEKYYGNVNTMEFWYDPNNADKLYAVFCLPDKPSYSSIETAFLKQQELLLRTYEQECIDITNAFRVCYDKPEVVYSADAAKIALKHAKDMAERNYFDHTNPEGLGPLERMLDGGLDVQKVTENCAGGFPDAIQVLKGWVESASHRLGMLEDNDYLGVGAYYKQNSKYQYYMVQNYLTYWK